MPIFSHENPRIIPWEFPFAMIKLENKTVLKGYFLTNNTFLCKREAADNTGGGDIYIWWSGTATFTSSFNTSFTTGVRIRSCSKYWMLFVDDPVWAGLKGDNGGREPFPFNTTGDWKSQSWKRNIPVEIILLHTSATLSRVTFRLSHWCSFKQEEKWRG